MEIQRSTCTLCMGKCETFKCIERSTKNFLDLFLPEMDFTIIQEPVMCENCAKTLAKCFEFKTTCLHTHDYLVSFVNNKDSVELDLNDLFQSRSMTDTGTPEDQEVCGFCMALVKNCNAVPLYIKDEDYKLDKMVQQCLPELDISIIKKPVICADCHSSLESCFRFVTDCLTAEQRIREYRENLDISSKGHIELSDLLHPAIKTEKTNVICSNLFDIVKIEKQSCEDVENPEQNKMVSGVDIIKLEETSNINGNSNNNNENVNENLMASDNPKVSNVQQLSPKNVLVWEEESTNLGAIKIEETLCEENESKCKDDLFVDLEDKKYLLNEETEIKTEGYDYNRSEENMDQQISTYRNPFETQMHKCKECEYETINATSMKQHVVIHEECLKRKKYKCKDCPYETVTWITMRNHRMTHTDHLGMPMHICKVCTYETNVKGSFKRHMMTHKDPSDRTKYKCKECMYEAISTASIWRHSFTHKDPSKVTIYKCNICIYETKFKGYFKLHTMRHKGRSQRQKFKCKSCPFEATSRLAFLHHGRMTHSLDIPIHKCQLCTYQTIQRSDLKRHMMTHKDRSERRKYKCKDCPYESMVKSGIEQHVMIHKDPSFMAVNKCDMCTYKTKDRQCLKRHMMTHKESEKYKCNNCPYETLHKHSLKRHMLTHKDYSEREKYKCTDCSYETITKSCMQKHIMAHKNPCAISMLKCEICQYETEYKKNMRRHMSTHKDPTKTKKNTNVNMKR